uniref:Triadin n=1 Tax=Strigops habroptila TaxID=2489341 RepID=A0A672TLP5_STRHB
MSTTTTIIDGKNESVPSSSMKVGKKSVTEDLMTTFSSPAAWLLVVALIVTWSAVAIVMFDLVDYKAFAGKIHILTCLHSSVARKVQKIISKHGNPKFILKKHKHRGPDS